MTRSVIVLVDDEKTVLDSLSEQLRRLYPRDVECETAESAEEAWELLQELADENIPVMVVVSDWLMPGQRGDEFLAQVRTTYPHIGRVMLTGQADPAALERARAEAAAHEILFKPWRSEELHDAIRRSTATSGGR
ncbi:MAG TPA: response regulator [Polyangiaceae bacterium]|nr:response regulator [Polyangiaceae bacterium]